jgi:hypothetical protein
VIFDPKPEGPAGIAMADHRSYVGGQWDVLGKLQFEFLLQRGLRPDDILLDIACGYTNRFSESTARSSSS